MRSPGLAIDEQFFLRIALKNGLLDEGQCREVLAEKARIRQRGDDTPIGQVCLDLGLLDRGAVRKLRGAQAASQVIRLDTIYADIAVERGLVDRKMVLWALDRQRARKYRVRIGELLVDAGILEPAEHRELLDELLRRIAEQERDARRAERASTGGRRAGAPSTGARPVRGPSTGDRPVSSASIADDPLPPSSIGDDFPSPGVSPIVRFASSDEQPPPAPLGVVRFASSDELPPPRGMPGAAASTDGFRPASDASLDPAEGTGDFVPPPARFGPSGDDGDASFETGDWVPPLAAGSEDLDAPEPDEIGRSRADPHGFLRSNMREIRRESEGEREAASIDDASDAGLLESALEMRLSEAARVAAPESIDDGASVDGDLLNDSSVFRKGLLDSDRVSVGSDIRQVEDLIGSGERTFAALDGLATSSSGQTFDPDAYVARRRGRNVRVAAAASVGVCVAVAVGSTLVASISAEQSAITSAGAAMEAWRKETDPATRARIVDDAHAALAAGSLVPWLRDEPGRLALDEELEAMTLVSGVGLAVAAERIDEARAGLKEVASRRDAGAIGNPPWLEEALTGLRYRVRVIGADRALAEGRLGVAARLYRQADYEPPMGATLARERLVALEADAAARVEAARARLDPDRERTFEDLVNAYRELAELFPHLEEQVDHQIRDLDYERLARRTKVAVDERQPGPALDGVRLARRYARTPSQQAELDGLEDAARKLRDYLHQRELGEQHHAAFRLKEAVEAYQVAADLERELAEFGLSFPGRKDGGSEPNAAEATLEVRATIAEQEADRRASDHYEKALAALRKSDARLAETEFGELVKVLRKKKERSDIVNRWVAVEKYCRTIRGMRFVPAGEFVMGSNVGEGNPNERPRHKTSVGRSFFMDEREVTNAEFMKFLNRANFKPPPGPGPVEFKWPPAPLLQKPNARRPKLKPAFEEHPVTHIRKTDVDAFCDWAGKRLPTEAEWEKAMRGEDGRLFPWGDEPSRTNANLDVPNRNPFQKKTTTAKVGTHPGDVSPYGLLDGGGNVAEWTQEQYNVYPGGPPLDEYNRGYFVIRGGSWKTDERKARCARRQFGSPTAWFSDVGFRCVVDIPNDLAELHRLP